MTEFRLANAPRLIEWTGERCVPWSPDAQNVYEHLHRYLWAAPLVAGRKVLDLASGEGFGAAILAQSAGRVIGVDIDPRTVEHSVLNYQAQVPNLEFCLADARDLSRFDDGSFGAVVALEMIEHVGDQRRVIAEIARVLAPDGLLVMSTPDRLAYAEATDEQNPFHVSELSGAEFTDLLSSKFSNIATWGQWPITGSALAALSDAHRTAGLQPQGFFVERLDDGWRLAPDLPPLYVVAVASNAALPAIARHSTLAEPSLEVIRSLECTIDELHHELDTQWRNAKQFADQAAERDATIAGLMFELADATERVQRVEGSVTWQLFQRARAFAFRLIGGEQPAAAHRLQGALRGLGRLLLGKRRSPRRRPPD